MAARNVMCCGGIPALFMPCKALAPRTRCRSLELRTLACCVVQFHASYEQKFAGHTRARSLCTLLAAADMHVAPGAHWVVRGLLLQSALDGSSGGGESEASPSPDAPPAPRAAMASPQAARVVDDDRLRLCQVPGCKSAPLAARSYLGRCRLCVPHMRADEVLLGGELLRFCQKCVARRRKPKVVVGRGVLGSWRQSRCLFPHA